MFDIGWTELIIIACVAILVVGPKDLPGMLRNVGRGIRSLRKLTGDFQRQFDEALKEAELDDVAKVAKSKSFQPLEDAKKSMEAYQKKLSAELNPDSEDTQASLNGKSPEVPEQGANETVAPAKQSARNAKSKSATAKPAGKKTTAKASAPKKPAAKRKASSAAAKTAPKTSKTKRSSASTGTSG